MKKIILSLLLLNCLKTLVAQSMVYVAYIPLGEGSIKVMLLDVETCTFCNVAELPLVSPNGGQQYQDMVVLPDGRIVIIRSGISNAPIEIFTPPSQNPVVVLPPVTVSGMVIGPNGTVYVYAASGLYELNLNTNTLNFIGAWPSGISFVDVELYVYNGQIFGVNMNNQAQRFQIDVNDPSQSLFVSDIPLNGSTYSSVGHFGDIVLLSQGPQFHTYNPLTEAVDFSCNLTAVMTQTTIAIAAIPEGSPLLACLCTTDAGTLPQTGPFNICPNGTLTFPPPTSTVLDANDLLRYIFFSNPNDTLGSIIATSATPSFTFNPATMQTGVTYYLAAIAGNNLNGNIDLNDPCLDISNAAEAVWQPLPIVTFSAANPNVCAGACTTVTATFTGTAPFTLTYNSPISGTMMQVFSGNTGTFQVCTAVGSLPGNLVVQATNLTDAWCTCQ